MMLQLLSQAEAIRGADQIARSLEFGEKGSQPNLVVTPSEDQIVDTDQQRASVDYGIC
jgi:hypothetical protein